MGVVWFSGWCDFFFFEFKEFGVGLDLLGLRLKLRRMGGSVREMRINWDLLVFLYLFLRFF